MSLYTTVRTELGILAIGHSERGITRVVLPSVDWHDISQAQLARAGLRTAGQTATQDQGH